jgi:hypothetical protein
LGLQVEWVPERGKGLESFRIRKRIAWPGELRKVKVGVKIYKPRELDGSQLTIYG